MADADRDDVGIVILLMLYGRGVAAQQPKRQLVLYRSFNVVLL
jgi:hypothetical protein